ncbi:3-hydroxybutyryl-CoA dehydrogenase [Sediminihabitans luteus]|uniref:3-hydroxybutyryl-CoA dehydrogenase n=1 Tax=Sediminihabitans luteus TaxID=1138585 RepID=A0A2M9CEV5_9CELL|nr:3-hydroxyacyl-CoA dehydrogenase family protein [Sediminihabitans luteus]PJJ70407.1 3-hydroxybutyryl-CoA dehydrogenase [Sediminihabitans luteus]GII97880.1 putative dehydrogenase (3-hydroxybutyryl-CoA dehydrogenase FadB?) [Sediminihabitans luteus]
MTTSLPTDIANRPVAVVGGGTLGRRIALMFATRGGTVRIFDLSDDVRAAALDYVAQTLPGLVESRDDATAGTVVGVASLAEAVENAWLVVEAIPERLELKRPLFAELDQVAPADAILASNSSSYASRLFVDGLTNKARALNMHFYMPPVQNAVDLMSDGETAPEVMELLKQELPAYGVFPFEARRESTGFIFNRFWAAMKREALAIIEEGVSTPEEFDQMFSINLGVPFGVFRLMDQVGLDVVLDIENHYADENPHLPEGPRRLLHEYVDAGNLGVKSGSGFYDYR